MPTCAEVEQLFTEHLGACAKTMMMPTSECEIYTVRAKVWTDAGMDRYGGCLCVGCLERRLGRTLKPKDFQHGDGLSHPSVPGTTRLLNRRGIRP
jgi:hypothetical protein